MRDRSRDAVEASISVDCATFDRVLLFLEASGKACQTRTEQPPKVASAASRADCPIASRADCPIASRADCAIASRADFAIASRADCALPSFLFQGLKDSFSFDINSLPQLADAAQALGCRPLKEATAKRLGAFEERIGMHRWYPPDDRT